MPLAPLPSPEAMLRDIEREQRTSAARYFKSKRHTIQRDPITYCDMIAEQFGAKPDVLSYPLDIMWRLIFGSGGAAQGSGGVVNGKVVGVGALTVVSLELSFSCSFSALLFAFAARLSKFAEHVAAPCPAPGRPCCRKVMQLYLPR